MEESTEALLLKAKLQIETNERIRNTSIFAPAVAGFCIIAYNNIAFPDKSSVIYTILNILGPSLLLASVFFTLIYYLQTGFKKQKPEDILFNTTIDSNGKIFTKHTSIYKVDNENISNTVESIRLLEQRINKLESFNREVPDVQTEELVNTLKTKIINDSISEASKDILHDINESLKRTLRMSEVEEILAQTIQRLYSEIKALARRGNINLILGGMTTLVGLSVLAYFVYEIGKPPLDDKISYIANFIPRLSVVILIEIFAFFFLKLYKSTLSEMKYFQNEMTNTEAKLAAIKCSIIVSDKDATSLVIKELITTERNTIIEKGQTTVEIEKNRLEQQNTAAILDSVLKALAVKK